MNSPNVEIQLDKFVQLKDKVIVGVTNFAGTKN